MSGSVLLPDCCRTLSKDHALAAAGGQLATRPNHTFQFLPQLLNAVSPVVVLEEISVLQVCDLAQHPEIELLPVKIGGIAVSTSTPFYTGAVRPLSISRQKLPIHVLLVEFFSTTIDAFSSPPLRSFEHGGIDHFRLCWFHALLLCEGLQYCSLLLVGARLRCVQQGRVERCVPSQVHHGFGRHSFIEQASHVGFAPLVQADFRGIETGADCNPLRCT